MWIVTFKAIADGWKVDASLDFIRIFITVALDAKLDWGYCPKIYARNIIVYTHLVATQAAGCDCRVDGLPLRFFFMAFHALAPIDVFVKVDRVLPCYC
jgi:hypothetical protein